MQQNISQQDLQIFAVAAVEVQRISDDYQTKFAAADTPHERQKIQQEATDRMTKAVEEKGMTVSQYNDVARVAQTDTDVAEQISEYVRQVG
jgi:hypothetical protein